MRGRPPPPTRAGKDKRGVSRLFAPLVALIVLFGFASVAVHNQSAGVLPTNSFRRSIAPQAATEPAAAGGGGDEAQEQRDGAIAQETAQREGVEEQAVAVPRLLAQRTPLWDQLQAEGLFHENSGYPQILPPGDKEAEDWKTWQDKVMADYPNGASLFPFVQG
jgi:hypothetical protein